VNLLQPTDRRSLASGDTRDAVEARARLRAAGIGGYGFDAFVAQALSRLRTGPDPTSVVVDIGSGSGETLGTIARTSPVIGIGIDLSTAAAEHAARRFPDETWVVANVDRALPLLDATVDLVLSQHARRHPAECARVLKPGGWLLVSVPAADDLGELRAAIQGEAVARSRIELVLAEHAADFAASEPIEVRERLTLGREPLLDLLRGTYRGNRTSTTARVSALAGLEVTLASIILPLRRRSAG
jgi:23S rRNA (guanine745-N1)-methyltransferase